MTRDHNGSFNYSIHNKNKSNIVDNNQSPTEHNKPKSNN